MLRKLMLASALIATSAIAQQNTDISGANFQSGKADAPLASLGRQAAASGKRLVITAPAEWHARIASKVRAGGNANLLLREGFYENVLVRVEDQAAADAEPERAAKSDVEKMKAEAAKAKADAEKSRAEAEKAKAEAETARNEANASKARADAEAARAEAATRQAAAARAAAAPPPPAAPAMKPATAVAAPANDSAATRARMEASLNEGRPATGSIGVPSLKQGDMIYVDGSERAISRREGNRRLLYWLDGDLDLRRSEIKMVSPTQYQVLGLIRGDGVLRRDAVTTASTLDAAEPADRSPTRLALEQSLNESRTITQTVVPSNLRNGDVIYVNGSAVAVVRREGGDLLRYWLTGSLDLTQNGIVADGANKYKILSDTVH
ncbi:MAG: hypothetical protein ABIR62_00120 [Dokdonella sp.]|uniref:hypothetical protein n=1 Tax=Dokdonella sp. TaxID=2291710 RepID=UPI003262E29F